jgi:AmiR/NasT family two-component response regulator
MAAVQWQKAVGNPVLAFAKHTDTDVITAARKAGIERVVARSGFEAALPTVLQEAAARVSKG